MNMSLTKFCQYLTKVLLIYWLVKDKKPLLSVCETLFQELTSSQALKILDPSFREEEMLIGMMLFICSRCYHMLEAKPIQKLKKKIALVEVVLSNVDEESFIIKCMCYGLLLMESAPGSLAQLLTNLQTTLINNNPHNLKLITTIITYCKLNAKECEALADKFIFHEGNE